MLIRPQSTNFAKIKVIGVGGGGGNAIGSMIAHGAIQGVDFVAINTDAQALLHNKADTKVQIGENITKGLGSGGDPENGRQAAEESAEKIKHMLEGSVSARSSPTAPALPSSSRSTNSCKAMPKASSGPTVSLFTAARGQEEEIPVFSGSHRIGASVVLSFLALHVASPISPRLAVPFIV